MLDIQLIRKEPDKIKKALETRVSGDIIDSILGFDKAHREKILLLEELNQKKNQANVEMVALKKKGGDTSVKIAEMKEVSQNIADYKKEVEEIGVKLKDLMLIIPNIPSSDTPIGTSAEQNKVVKEPGALKDFQFTPKDHIELCENLDLVDFERSTKLSGSSFLLFKGEGARLERALINFMLDLHTLNHGYSEVSPPYLVKRSTMQGTGQLPKFEHDLYRVYRGDSNLEDGTPDNNDAFLIPTAEVPVTNLHAQEILQHDSLPISYVAHTPCFRLEAGAYGKDTKGMIRVHQFDKVELVKLCKPEDSEKEHQILLEHAEKVLELLEIPYRIVQLCHGDLGFSASKCFDIEVWAPGLNQWLEASSCSNFLDFQARRAGIRYKDPDTKKTKFVHTLNGSGLALPRTFIALLENHQKEDGSIHIPSALRPYFNDKSSIES